MVKILIFLSVLLTINGLVAIRIVARSTWADHHKLLVIGLMIAFMGLQVLGFLGDRFFFQRLRSIDDASALIKAADWISYSTLGVLSCLFLYGIVLEIVDLVRLLMTSSSTIDFNRRALFTLGTVTLGTMVVGVQQALAGPQVKTINIPLKNLPPVFDGFKIVQVSDLHLGSTIGRDYAQNVVTIVNDLKPDLVVLTGDFIDGSVDQLRDAVAPLAQLKAVEGTYYITGNHEYYWGAEAWIEEFKRLGARVLLNEHTVIRREQEEFVLAGVTDYSTMHMDLKEASDPEKALKGAPSDRVKILLAHQPASYRAAHEAGFDLQISGHTHGGQYFPFNILVALVQRYYKGLNRHENMWIYVNSGTGYWGPPLRTGVPSEISMIVLRPEHASAI